MQPRKAAKDAKNKIIPAEVFASLVPFWAKKDWKVLPLSGKKIMDWKMSASITIFSPAKINLFLAITGRRPDGFHDLLSVAAPVSFGDELTIETRVGQGTFTLTCTDPTVPPDSTNLILRAAESFRAALQNRDTGCQPVDLKRDTGCQPVFPPPPAWAPTCGAKFTLTKKIPMAAGLGGGSSNATATLRALNELAGRPLDDARLAELAVTIGSDCALFLQGAPVIMRGRGERITALAATAAQRLSGRRVLLFKPDISINTAWSYRRLAARAPAGYLPAEQAEARLASWIETNAPAEDLLYNNMEPPAFEKFPALPLLLARLRARFNVAAAMSGSGSACFALLRENHDAVAITEYVRAAWGRAAFVAEAKICADNRFHNP